jgi:hypothetical protein
LSKSRFYRSIASGLFGDMLKEQGLGKVTGSGTETALYAYGASFAAIKAIIEPSLAKYSLCQLARVVQIA